MTLDPIIFFDLVITIFILASVIVILTIYFLRLIKKLQSQIQASVKDETLKKNLSLSEETRNKAIRIIDDANSKALDIIQRAHLFSGISNDYFNDELKAVTERKLNVFEKTTEDFIKVYQTVLNELKSKNVEIFQNVSKNIEASTLDEIKKFKSIIEKETIASQNLVKKKIDYEYSLAKRDIEVYKQSELKIVDEKIYEILETISKLVLGKTIPLSQQEDLIIESLAKAKKEGMFDDGK